MNAKLTTAIDTITAATDHGQHVLPQIRRAVRAFLLTATPEELERDLWLSIEAGDYVRANIVMDLITNPEK